MGTHYTNYIFKTMIISLSPEQFRSQYSLIGKKITHTLTTLSYHMKTTLIYLPYFKLTYYGKQKITHTLNNLLYQNNFNLFAVQKNQSHTSKETLLEQLLGSKCDRKVKIFLPNNYTFLTQKKTLLNLQLGGLLNSTRIFFKKKIKKESFVTTQKVVHCVGVSVSILLISKTFFSKVDNNQAITSPVVVLSNKIKELEHSLSKKLKYYQLFLKNLLVRKKFLYFLTKQFQILCKIFVERVVELA
eukprot:TRINITY_DN24090_c0_g1_i15.p1 TRINITY_DN24090_c0_g1~~TRINITY_DN24090_c0_g1_i15.p1  ORF type:complete len:244 (+),score=-6.92 TRINITY_DN24090_c0_g1_i15:165-896(+)